MSALTGKQRILVVGCSGAGKSTFSRQLADACGLPVLHLDQHFWQPGWVPMADEPWERVVEELLSKPRWVMDGGYHRTLPRRLETADAVVFLDLPRHICLFRIVKRVATGYGRIRPDLAPGCPEQWDWDFVRWVWNWGRDVRPPMCEALAGAPAEVPVITLHSPHEVAAFLRDTRNAGPTAGGA